MSFWGSIDASDWLSAFSIVLNIGAVLQVRTNLSIAQPAVGPGVSSY